MPTLDWIGKRAVVNHHRALPYRLLHCDAALGAGDTAAGNLLVEGDNLHALKALLPYYAGRVKCIYIDPPYNTGNEGWVYNDAVNAPEIQKWLGDTVGREAEDLSRHDKWLCMMYPRLALLREFLREDGVIFVSVDENEHRHLALLMDELFGPTNRIETLIWKKSYGGGSKSKHIVNQHEYIEFFAKRRELIGELELPPDEKALRYYKFQDGKFAERGPYRLQPLATNSMDARPNLRYPIPYAGKEIWPEKQWQWSKERALTALANDELVIAQKKGKWSVSYKQYLRDPEGEERSSKAYSIIDGIYTQQGTNEVREIFGDGKAFTFPKPSKLIAHLLRIATKSGDLVLDSFAGSGTTGHAVLTLNAEDGGNRRFILTQMPYESTAQAAEKRSIAREITAERLRRVINSQGELLGLGGGFRFCTLGEPLLNEDGHLDAAVKWRDLAHHLWFTETGAPISREEVRPQPGEDVSGTAAVLRETATATTSLIGVAADGRAVYLLYNGILGDRRPSGGNVLTAEVLAELPPHAGPRVVYGEACTLRDTTLSRARVVFKQIPYQVRHQ